MQLVSQAYQNEMSSELRGQGYTRIIFGLVDIDAAGDASCGDNGHIYYSQTSALAKEDGIPESTYATFEPGRMKMDGTQLIPSRKTIISQGYISVSYTHLDVYKRQPLHRLPHQQTLKCRI